MFTDEEKEYVLLAYYLGRKKLLNCIALQQLTQDILDVLHSESPIPLRRDKNINSVTGCCLCKEKETIFKDFLEYHLLKDNTTGCEEVHEKDVENVWTDVSHLWKNLHKFDGLMPGRQLILTYEKAGQALMKTHNVKVSDYIKKKYGELENLENWSRIICKVQGALQSLKEEFIEMSNLEAPVQSVLKVPNSGESVRVAQIILNVEGNAAILAKYIMQCRTFGIEATTLSPVSVRIKYMVCLKCSMENDYSQPISVLGLHSKYLTSSQRMFLLFEKKLLRNGRNVDYEQYTTRFQRHRKSSDSTTPSVINQRILSFGKKNTVDQVISNVFTVPCSNQGKATKTVSNLTTPTTSALFSKDDCGHESINKKGCKIAKGRSKHDHVPRRRPVRFTDDKVQHETLGETLSQLEQFQAKFLKIQELKQVRDLQRHIPVPHMPIMTKFKVNRPAEGEPWPIYCARPEESIESAAPPEKSTPAPPAATKTYKCNLRISSYELFDDRDCTLFPELDPTENNLLPSALSDNMSNPFHSKIVDVPIITSFPREIECSRKRPAKHRNALAVQSTRSHKPKLPPEDDVTDNETEFLTSIRPGAPEANPQETKEEFKQTAEKTPAEVDTLHNITHCIESALAEHSDGNNSNSNFHESYESDDAAFSDQYHDESGSNSEFSICVAEYLAKFVPHLDDTLKSFLARRQRISKAKTEPSKLHFSHYLCSQTGIMVNESLSHEFSCSKLVRVGTPAKATALKSKNCEWMPRSLSRKTRLVLHEQILRHKQATIDQRAAAKAAQKKIKTQRKIKTARSRKWRHRAMRYRNNTRSFDCISLKNGEMDHDQRNTDTNVSRKSLNDEGAMPGTSNQYLVDPHQRTDHFDGSTKDKLEKIPEHPMNNNLLKTEHSGLERVQNFEFNSEESDHETCSASEWKVSKPHPSKWHTADQAERTNECLPENRSNAPSVRVASARTIAPQSSDTKLKMRYKRDSEGNWKHIDFKRSKLFNIKANPLQKRSSMQRCTSLSEFQHKLSTISHHRPPKIGKSSNRNQSIVHNFFNFFRKSKDKRRRSMINSSKSLLFSSSYLPSFEKVGFTAINPSPHVFAATPKLQRVVMSRRQKSAPDISRLTTKPNNTVAHVPVSKFSGEILQHSSIVHRNFATVTNAGEKPNSSLSTKTDLHTKFNTKNLLWNDHIVKHSSCSSIISAEYAEFAVTALNETLIFASSDDTMSTADCSDSYSHASIEDEKMEYRQENCAVADENLLNELGEDSYTCQETNDLSIAVRTPSLAEKTRQTLKVFDRSVVTPISSFDCNYMTDYKYHLSYESVFTIMNSLAKTCQPEHLDRAVPDVSKQIDWENQKLWKSDDRLLMALKYCFASKNLTPDMKRYSNERIDKTLVSFRKFCDRVARQQLLKKNEIKVKDISKTLYHRYWWTVPSHLPYRKNQLEALPPAKPMSANMINGQTTSPRKYEDNASVNGEQGQAELELPFVTNADSNALSRLKSFENLDIGARTKTSNNSNHSTQLGSYAKANIDDPGNPQATSLRESAVQPDMLQRVSKRKRKLGAKDGPLNIKRIRALMTADESNMRRYTEACTAEQNARCLQPLFESSLNIHSVNRVLYDSANAKSFSLVPSEFAQNTPAVFELGNQSLPLVQVSEDAYVRLDPKDGDKMKSWTSCRRAYVPLEQCPSTTVNLGMTVSVPYSRYQRLPYLLRFKTRPCSPKGLSRAKRSRVKWDFVRRGRMPKNVGIRTPPSRNCNAHQPLFEANEISMILFGKSPVLNIPKCNI